MRRISLIRVLSLLTLAAAMCCISLLHAAENAGSLLLDGKLQVEEGDLTGASITVYRDDELQRTITEDVKRFALELELGHSYRVAFARPGCTTKELAIDAHVPDAEAAMKLYGFRFQVTLAPADGQEAGGPVAVVRFDSEEGGFNYDRAKDPTDETQSRQRKQVRSFEDPTTGLAAWVEAKRNTQ